MLWGSNATLADARAVLSDLSEITATDLAKRHYPDGVLDQALKQLFRDGAVHKLVEDGETLCVIGLSLSDDEWLSWLLAREPFWSARPSIWRMMRRYSRSVLSGLGTDIHAYSGSDHPALGRWMKVLGFEEVERDAYNLRHFIFRA